MWETINDQEDAASPGQNADDEAAAVQEEVWEVEAIRGCKTENGVLFYFLKWKGYAEERK